MDFVSIARSRYVQAGLAIGLGYMMKRLLFSSPEEDELASGAKLGSVPLQTAIDRIFDNKIFPKRLTADDLFDCEMMDDLPSDALAKKRLPFFRIVRRYIEDETSVGAFDAAFVKRLVSLFEHRTDALERTEVTETLRLLSEYVPGLKTSIISALESALCQFIDDKQTYFIGVAEILQCYCMVLAICSLPREQMELKCRRIVRPLLKHPLLPQFHSALSDLNRVLSQHGARTAIVQTIKTVCPSVVPRRQAILLSMLARSVQAAPVDERGRLARSIIPLLMSKIGIHHVTTLQALTFLQATWFCEAAGQELSVFEPLLEDCKHHFCHLVREMAEAISLSRYLGTKSAQQKRPAFQRRPMAYDPAQRKTIEDTTDSAGPLPVQVHATFVTVNFTTNVTNNVFVLAPDAAVC